MNKLWFFLLSTCLFLSPQAVTTVYKSPLTSIPNNAFSVQYSYDKPNLDPAYISANSSGLTLSLYPTDKPHSPTSKTLPRTELLYKNFLLDNTTYIYSIQQQIVAYNSNYEYCFMQLFGDGGPNILVRWKYGVFELITRNGNHRAPSSIKPVLNQWREWKLVFNLKSFIRVYLDGSLILSHSGPSSVGGRFKPKFGIYSQNSPPARATMKYKNINIMQP